MDKIVQCVPNFSEGQNKETIKAITHAIEDTKGCSLLDVDPGKSTNRTVYTFVGSPKAVIEAALNAAKQAEKRIDMTVHKGGHHRMGALDVCPFIPVANTTMEECVEISKEFGGRLAKELNVPVFLYEESSDRDYRKKLSQIREGQYEELKNRITMEKWKPDFGPAKFVPKWGASVTGARFFLIAYNVNLLSTPNQAHRIALNLREAGRSDSEPGKLKQVKGMGWYVDEYNLAQVTVNLTNYHVTSLHTMFEEVKKEAEKLNVAVTGSKIVGVVPLEAILMAAEYYIKKENLFVLDEDQKVRLAIERLGLSSISFFDPKKKIIEYIIAKEKNEPLAKQSLREFICNLAARSSAPGGGSASASIAAMGTGLGSMAAKLTLGVRKFESLDAKMRLIVPKLHEATLKLISMVDADTKAFNDYMDALRLSCNPKEKEKKIQDSLKAAVDVPLNTMIISDSVWSEMLKAAQYANIASKSDIEVGAKALETGIFGAYKNVVINMPDISDKKFVEKTLKKAKAINKRAKQKCEKVLEILEKRQSR